MYTDLNRMIWEWNNDLSADGDKTLASLTTDFSRSAELFEEEPIFTYFKRGHNFPPIHSSLLHK